MDSNNITKIGDNKVESRRGFIKKSSVVAGISILPASNVWGACNVSGVSGGSQNIATTCVVRPFHGGYSNHYWKSLTKDAFSANSSDYAKFTFVDFEDPNTSREEYYPEIAALFSKANISISGGGKIPTLNTTVFLAIRSASLEEQLLASLYINLIFGFVTNLDAQYSGPSGNRALLEHVWGSLHEGVPGSASHVINGSFNGIGSMSETEFLNMLTNNLIFV